MPTVSVIIAAYNCRATIGKAIESVCNQTLRDIEIIVADDASTDGTYDLVKSLADVDKRIKLMKLPQNGGPGVARNAAINAAVGEWIAVLDADDWYETNRLDNLLNAAKQLNADLVCDNLKIYDHARGEVVNQTRYGGKEIIPLTPEFLFLHDTPLQLVAIGYLKPMARREFLKAHNIAYNPQYRAGEDFLFLVEAPLNGGKAFLVPEAYYVYVHRISPTTRKISPHSHSDAGFDLAVRGCDYILEKYGASLSPETRRAVLKKRWIFESRIKCGDMLSALRQKKIMQAVNILVQRPFILTLLGTTLAKLIYSNIMVCLPKTKKSGSA